MGEVKPSPLEVEENMLVNSDSGVDSSIAEATIKDLLEQKARSEILSEANASTQQFKTMEALIEQRAREAGIKFQNLYLINPDNPNSPAPVSRKTYSALKKEFNDFRDDTAVLVEACNSSKFYTSNVPDIDSILNIGSAKPVESFDHSDVRWHSRRYNTVGGSDVAALAAVDFTPASKLSGLDKLSLKRIEKSKIEAVEKNEIVRSIALSESRGAGALYRGSMWEERILSQYAAQHPNDNIHRSKLQYIGEYDWQIVNFDGVSLKNNTSDAQYILEIKTGSDPQRFERELPVNYRAQVLYYLYVTGLQHAVVRVLVNDNQVIDFVVYRDEEIVSGCGTTMSQYVNDRVYPWFTFLVSQR